MVKLYRRRYLLFKTFTLQGKIGWSSIKDTIFDSFQALFGISGLSQADLVFIHYDEDRGLGILRCSHKFVDNVRASLALIQNVEGKNASLNVLRVSGTIKKLKSVLAEESCMGN